MGDQFLEIGNPVAIEIIVGTLLERVKIWVFPLVGRSVAITGDRQGVVQHRAVEKILPTIGVARGEHGSNRKSQGSSVRTQQPVSSPNLRARIRGKGDAPLSAPDVDMTRRRRTMNQSHIGAKGDESPVRAGGYPTNPSPRIAAAKRNGDNFETNPDDGCHDQILAEV